MTLNLHWTQPTGVLAVALMAAGCGGGSGSGSGGSGLGGSSNIGQALAALESTANSDEAQVAFDRWVVASQSEFTGQDDDGFDANLEINAEAGQEITMYFPHVGGTLNKAVVFDRNDRSPDSSDTVGNNWAYQANALGAFDGYVIAEGIGDTGGSRHIVIYTDKVKTAAGGTEDNSEIAFGFWLDDTPATPTVSRSFGFQAFRAGGTEATVANTLTETATYNGKATGYHKKQATPDLDASDLSVLPPVIVYAEQAFVEAFDADVQLMASWDDASTIGTVTGTISGGTLGETITLASGTINGTTGGISGTTSANIDSEAYTGNWNAQFYNRDATTNVPGAAAGTFAIERGSTGSTFPIYFERYVGAFGAHLDESGG